MNEYYMENQNYIYHLSKLNASISGTLFHLSRLISKRSFVEVLRDLWDNSIFNKWRVKIELPETKEVRQAGKKTESLAPWNNSLNSAHLPISS